MNFAHIHLVMNDIPLVAIPMALIFLTHGEVTGSPKAKRFALLILAAAAALVVPVYFSGENAEDAVEKLSGINKALIETHEAAASFSLALGSITAGLALVALIFQRDGKRGRIAAGAAVIFSLLAVGSLLYTSALGGQIRHSAELGGTPAGSGHSARET